MSETTMGASGIETGLWISDIHHVMEHDVGEMYDTVITCCRNDPSLPTDCPAVHERFGLWDDDVDQQSTFDDAVDVVRSQIQGSGRERATLVHCMAGQSRSPAVVATAIAARDDIRFDDARDRVWQQRPTIAIHPALRRHGRQYLGEETYADRV